MATPCKTLVGYHNRVSLSLQPNERALSSQGPSRCPPTAAPTSLLPSLSTGSHQHALCFYDFAISRKLHKWNQTLGNFLGGFFYSAWSYRDSSKLSHVAIFCSFLSLSSIPTSLLRHWLSESRIINTYKTKTHQLDLHTEQPTETIPLIFLGDC